jgi:hypothetical protein
MRSRTPMNERRSEQSDTICSDPFFIRRTAPMMLRDPSSSRGHHAWSVLISLVTATVSCGGLVTGVGQGSSGAGGSSGASGSGGSGGSGSMGGSGGAAGSGGTSGDGGTAGSGPVDAGPGCPAEMPTKGRSCDSPDLWCEYGDPLTPGCDYIFHCITTSIRWQRENIGNCPDVATALCPSYTPSNGKECGGFNPGGDCPPPNAGEACAYAETYCVCPLTPCEGTKPQPLWSCNSPGPSEYCPSSAPRLGTTCVEGPETVICSYGACAGGIAEECKNGRWAVGTIACP